MIPYGRQTIAEEDIDAVVEVLNSDFLTTGPKVPQFEEAVKSSVNAQHAVALNSATSALHVACLALGLKKGDALWTTPNTFVASANCGAYCGAHIDFVDIEIETGNLCPQKLEEKLKLAKKGNTLPKIVVPVHFAGQPTQQEKIWELSKKYGFRIIEDASHALGASRNGEPVGSCRWSDITIFSFHPVKIITTGEGGMAVTNCEKTADNMRLLRSHGITREKSRFPATECPSLGSKGIYPKDAYYEQVTLGFNYRMNDMEAALGISQLKKLPNIITERNRLADYYRSSLEKLPVEPLKLKNGNMSSYHLFIIRFPQNDKTVTRNIVFECLKNKGVGVNLHYLPVHLQPFYRQKGFKEGDFPSSERYSKEAITLPLYPGLERSQINEILRIISEAL